MCQGSGIALRRVSRAMRRLTGVGLCVGRSMWVSSASAPACARSAKQLEGQCGGAGCLWRAQCGLVVLATTASPCMSGTSRHPAACTAVHCFAGCCRRVLQLLEMVRSLRLYANVIRSSGPPGAHDKVEAVPGGLRREVFATLVNGAGEQHAPVRGRCPLFGQGYHRFILTRRDASGWKPTRTTTNRAEHRHKQKLNAQYRQTQRGTNKRLGRNRTLPLSDCHRTVAISIARQCLG
jgi:hypothetical protein